MVSTVFCEARITVVSFSSVPWRKYVVFWDKVQKDVKQIPVIKASVVEFYISAVWMHEALYLFFCDPVQAVRNLLILFFMWVNLHIL